MKQLFKSIMLAAIGVFLLIAPASAEVRTITTTGVYTAGSSESIDTAKQTALQDAMRLATEQAGVLVSSYSKTSNMTLTADEVTTVAAKVIKVTDEVYDVKLISDASLKVTATITAKIDTDTIRADIARLRHENLALKAENTQQKEKIDIIYELEKLEKEILEKYQSRYHTDQIIKLPKLTLESTWQECYEHFLYDMSHHDYYSAGGSRMMMNRAYCKNKPAKYEDATTCSFGLMEAERLFLKKDYGLSLRFFRIYRDIIEANNIDDLNPMVENDLPRYYDVLYSYMEQYHPEWKKFVFKKP